MSDETRVVIGHGVLHSKGWHWAVTDPEVGRVTGYAFTLGAARRAVKRTIRRNEKARRHAEQAGWETSYS